MHYKHNLNQLNLRKPVKQDCGNLTDKNRHQIFDMSLQQRQLAPTISICNKQMHLII